MTTLLAVVGLVAVLVRARPLEPLRRLAGMLHPEVARAVRCPMCVGFWVGLAASLVGRGVVGCPVLDAALVSYVSWPAVLGCDLLERRACAS